MNLLETRAYKRAFEAYIRRGIPIERSLKMARRRDAASEEHSTTHYVWRTAGDGKVRTSHAENEGKIFSWDEPPPVGHPGEDYNCRCTAEPYVEGETEFAYQELIGEIPSKIFNKWNSADFLYHFRFGDGSAIDLAKTGNLVDLVNFYNYKIIRDRKNSIERLKAQIIDEARKHSSGNFAYDFSQSYKELGDFIYSFGTAKVGGRFNGTVRYDNGMMFIEGNVDFRFDDVFTDPRSKRQDTIGTSDVGAATQEMLDGTEYGGTFYPIVGKWSATFKAEAKQNEDASRYKWD